MAVATVPDWLAVGFLRTPKVTAVVECNCYKILCLNLKSSTKFVFNYFLYQGFLKVSFSQLL